MYGTIARMQIKPEMGEQAISLFRSLYETIQIPGQVAGYVNQSDSDPDEIWIVAIFDSRESYWANAESPGQNERYMAMMEVLATEPEWHDGTVIATT